MKDWIRFGAHGEQGINFEPRPGRVAIYVLLDFQRRVRYVGATTDVSKRIKAHLKDCKGLRRAFWIDKVKREGLGAWVTVVQDVHVRHAAEAERQWIRFYQDRGLLFNSRTVEAPYRPRQPLPRILNRGLRVSDYLGDCCGDFLQPGMVRT